MKRTNLLLFFFSHNTFTTFNIEEYPEYLHIFWSCPFFTLFLIRYDVITQDKKNRKKDSDALKQQTYTKLYVD